MAVGPELRHQEIDANVFATYRATGDGPLPLAFFARLQSVPEILNVQRQSFLGGTYRKPDQNVTAIATDIAILIKDKRTPLWRRRTCVMAMERTRDGVLVGRKLAEEYGWKTGDRIALQSRLLQQSGSRDWGFQVMGIVSDPQTFGMEGVLLINWDYLNEARADMKNTVNRYIVRMRDPHTAPVIAQQIDRMFANSSDETRTESLSELAEFAAICG
jgi:putative ABC transport system permease protein